MVESYAGIIPGKEAIGLLLAHEALSNTGNDEILDGVQAVAGDTDLVVHDIEADEYKRIYRSIN